MALAEPGALEATTHRAEVGPERARDAGFDRPLSKPNEPGELLRVLLAH